jgi:hypothetical protein
MQKGIKSDQQLGGGLTRRLQTWLSLFFRTNNIARVYADNYLKKMKKKDHRQQVRKDHL